MRLADPLRVRLLLAAGLCLALVSGVAMTDSRGQHAIAALAGAAVVGYALLHANGVVLGVLLLGILNAIPLIDFDALASTGSFEPKDVLVLALMGALGWRIARRDAFVLPRFGGLALGWGAVLLTWWVVTWSRSVVFMDITPLHAALYGRDFLFMSVLLPLLVLGLERSDLKPLLLTVAIGTGLVAVGHVLIVLAGQSMDLLVHATVSVQRGVSRIYAPADDLIVLGFALSLGATLLGSTPRIRRVGAVGAGLGLLTVLLLQTRALYAAVVLAIVGVTAWSLLTSRQLAPVLSPLIIRAVAALVAVLLALAVLFPHVLADSTFGALTTRAASGFADATSGTGTVGYRQQLSATLFELLGHRWPVGLGFLHPADFYVSDLPSGSIRNSDVGFTNALMTMGLVGTVLVYLAPVAGAVVALRELAARPLTGSSWVTYGAAIWIITVLIGSVTLVTLFSDSGQPLMATAIAVVAVLAREPE